MNLRQLSEFYKLETQDSPVSFKFFQQAIKWNEKEFYKNFTNNEKAKAFNAPNPSILPDSYQEELIFAFESSSYASSVMVASNFKPENWAKITEIYSKINQKMFDLEISSWKLDYEIGYEIDNKDIENIQDATVNAWLDRSYIIPWLKQPLDITNEMNEIGKVMAEDIKFVIDEEYAKANQTQWGHFVKK